MKYLKICYFKLIGIILLLIGMVAAIYGPMEIYVFYFFSEGGQFHYPGFRIGSFWFATLVVFNAAYYVIASLLIPLGIGHLKLRRWALTLSLLYLKFWLWSGIILAGNWVVLITKASRLELVQGPWIFRLTVISALLLFCLIILPAFLLRLYSSERVKWVFETHDPTNYWTERFPFPLLALILIFAFMILVMHIAIFFQGVFPLFGRILIGRQSVFLISLCIFCLGSLIYGLSQLKNWAWWGSLVSVFLLTLSTLITFIKNDFLDIITILDLPADEIDFLKKVPAVNDYYFVTLLFPPLVIALGLILYSKQYFVKGN